MKRLKMSKPLRREIAARYRCLYKVADRYRKTEMLDDFVEITGYSRKHAIVLLSRPAQTPRAVASVKHHRKPTYTTATLKALERVWELSNRLCSKRLLPFLRAFLPKLEAVGAVQLNNHTRCQLLCLSAATADRHLRGVRRTRRGHGLCATRPGSLLKSQIPIRTFADWQDNRPGFTEADVVVHTDDLSGGEYLATLVLTDVATGWTESRPLLRHNQQCVCAALENIRSSLPFPLLGINTDNGSEFINRTPLAYCRKNQITFTRGRPRKKNDQCRVEQKNGHIVRSLVGYDRYQGIVAFRRLNALYHYAGLWVNFFQPSQKLIGKTRNGAKVTKSYDEAKTPYQRALDSDAVSNENKQALRDLYTALNPVTLLRQVRHAQHQLKLTTNQPKSDS